MLGWQPTHPVQDRVANAKTGQRWRRRDRRQRGQHFFGDGRRIIRCGRIGFAGRLDIGCVGFVQRIGLTRGLSRRGCRLRRRRLLLLGVVFWFCGRFGGLGCAGRLARKFQLSGIMNGKCVGGDFFPSESAGVSVTPPAWRPRKVGDLIADPRQGRFLAAAVDTRAAESYSLFFSAT